MSTKKTDYHHGDLRGSLLDAARQVLEQEGPNALSLRDLARRTGVSHAAPYRHFANRQALLAALAAEGFSELARHMRAEERKSLKSMGRAYVGFAVANPSLYKLMFSPELDRKKPQQLNDAAADAFGLLQGKAGAISHQHSGSLAAWAMVHGLSQILIDRLLVDNLLEPGQLPELIGSVLEHLDIPGQQDQSSS